MGKVIALVCLLLHAAHTMSEQLMVHRLDNDVVDAVMQEMETERKEVTSRHETIQNEVTNLIESDKGAGSSSASPADPPNNIE